MPILTVHRIAWLAVLMAAMTAGRVRAQEPENPPNLQEDLIRQAREISTELEGRSLNADLVKRQRDLAHRLRELLTGSTPGKPDQADSTEDTGESTKTASPNPEQQTIDSPLPVPGGSPLPGPLNDAAVREQVPLAVPRPLTDAVWGHLPPHEREELYRSFSEKFLPKYESALKEYYRALAKQPAKPSP